MSVHHFHIFLLIVPWINLTHSHPQLSYEDARNAVIQAEDQLITGGRLHLNDQEAKVNDLLMDHKLKELAYGFQNTDQNAAGLHFFKGKDLIERSQVFKFLKRMPKGGLLHVHNSASVSSEWVVRNISYIPGLLRCTNKEGVSILSFRRAPRDHGCLSRYVLVSEERLRAINSKAYDHSFEQLINLYTPVPELEYPSISRVWKKFEDMFGTINDMLRYIPAYRAYHWRLLEELYEDNIMYAEVRMSFAELYDYSGRLFPADYTVKLLLSVVEDFRRIYPKFMGIKTIFSTHRDVERKEVYEKFQTFKSLHAAYPKFIIGFDLVGQEDKGKPLHEFVDALTNMPQSANYFFHAGETNWYGASTDFNLLDALLHNTKRIGHGYALMKHPLLWSAVKKRDIAVEVNPISNQVLHLVSDLRNHPGGFFISQNIPMVISCDDPGFWGAKGVSYDFYYAIMSLAPNHAGLKTLKQLVWNSIRYAVLTEDERNAAYDRLQREWDQFLNEVLSGNVL